MGLLSFVKDAGEKLFAGIADAQSRADAIRIYIGGLQGLDGVDPMALEVSFDDGSATVTVSGDVADQEAAEKVVLCCGNVSGVAAVDNQLNVLALFGESQFHTVAGGDTLSKIAQRFYGDANQYPVLLEGNKPMLRTPDFIYARQMLRIPLLT